MDGLEEVEAHYDELDLLYRKIWGRHLHHGRWVDEAMSQEEASQALVELVIQRLELSRGQRVCDVGCGDGLFAIELARRFGVEVTGFTISKRQEERAEIPEGVGASVIRRDWLANQCDPDSYDAVTAIESLAHMPDPSLAVREMARVLRPGGRGCLCCWLRTEDALPWESRWLLDPIRRDGRLFGMGTKDDLTGWFRESGLVLEHSEDLSRQVERTWTSCLLKSIVLLANDREFLGFVRTNFRRSLALGLTLCRIAIAYRLGAMRYLVFTVTKPR